MPSKEHLALKFDICTILQSAQPDETVKTADLILSTILAALQEPTEGMIDAYFDRCRNLGIFTHINANAAWRAMLAASAIGEQGE